MKSLEFLSSIFILWLLIKVIRKGWRVFIALFFASMISGCASSSKSVEKSPCACNFESLAAIIPGEGNA